MLAIVAAYVWIVRTSTTVVALDNLSGEEVLGLVGAHHAAKGMEICAEEESSDIAAEPYQHGLTNSDLPGDDILQLLAQRGAILDDHEHRHYDTHRLLLVSWDTTAFELGEGYGKELGSVFELHHLKDETGTSWEIVYTATVFECPIEYPQQEDNN